MKKISYFLLILSILIVSSCGGGGDDPITPIPTNQNPGAFSINITDIERTEATLDWTDSVDPDGDVVKYKIEQEGVVIANNLTSSIYTVIDLSSNTSYSGKITAFDSKGGETVKSYSYKTLLNANPSSFTIEITAITNSEATLDWTDSTDDDGDTISYTITLGNETFEDINQSNFTLTNLNANTNYNGTITAIDGYGGETSVDFNFSTTSSGNAGSFTIPANLQDYYSEVDFTLTGNELYDELATLTIAKHTTILEYTDRHDYLYDADEDENNTDNVILVYSGESRYWKEYAGNPYGYTETFNTEHIYPKSLIVSTAETDLHHLRVCDDGINSSRSNYPFTDGSGSYALINGNSWFPGDDWKGDVARMIMYINLRYNESWTDISTEGLDLFIRWNEEDPVSSIEIQRNNVFEGAQGNRNPFIDNPYLATIIWGGNDAENKW